VTVFNRATSGYQGPTHVWKYPVVDATEPVSIRTVQGYVVITIHERDRGYDETIEFLDTDGKPFAEFTPARLTMFGRAWEEATHEIFRASSDDQGPPESRGWIICAKG